MHNYLSLKQITDKLGGRLSQDNADVTVSHVSSLAIASDGAISFFNDSKYTTQLLATNASAVILKSEHAVLTPLPAIITDNPYAYFAKVSQLLNPADEKLAGVHTSASVHGSVKVPESCHIGANVVIERGVILGDDVVIGAGCVVGKETTVGDATVLEANVTIKHGCEIGRHCHIFSGAVIGSDGFGYAEEADETQFKRWVKIPQVGNTIIHDHVDIGANTTIDRGAIDDTVIEEGVKIDNLVQIAHNCRIGAHTVIAACVGIAGSAIVGKHCKIGGAVVILGHLSIAENVTISIGSVITRSILKSGTYTALMPFQEHGKWLKSAANIRHLDQLTSKIKALESAVEHLKKSS